MSGKRSRIGSHVFLPIESSDSEVRPTPQSAVVKPPPKCLKPCVAENYAELPPPPRVLVPTPPFQERIGGFLENCCYCNKKIGYNDDVFMYSEFRAFCTAVCRDTQIALDDEMEKKSAKSKVVDQGPREEVVFGL